jgi:hypothetical protein
MIIMGGFQKGKALIFGIMGIVFLVLAFTAGSFTKTLFLIMGVSWLAAAGFSFWMAKAAEPKQDPSQPGTPGNWVG